MMETDFDLVEHGSERFYSFDETKTQSKVHSIVLNCVEEGRCTRADGYAGRIAKVQATQCGRGGGDGERLDEVKRSCVWKQKDATKGVCG